jgi:hypothetical protein
MARVMWKSAHPRSLYQNRRRRRDALRAAAASLADAERIPLTVLLFLLLGLPLLLRPTLFTDFAAMQWWARIWTPVWIIVTCGLYAIFFLPRVPTQIVGASVDAMEQADPDIEFVRVQERIETICLHALVPTDIHQQNATVHASINRAWQDRYRRRRARLRELDFPALWFNPRLSSSRDSSD